jgi:DNA-binding GntR family transcriptional regulator
MMAMSPKSGSQALSEAARPHDPVHQEPGAPLYLRISAALQGEIADGVYPLSRMLPTETELCFRFGVSRYTIREALRRLSEIGLVQRRAGAGTVVVATAPPTTFVHRVATLRGLLAYPENTYRELVSTEFLKADEQIADAIDCPPGKEWFRLSCLRKSDDHPTPICWGEFYVPMETGTSIDWPRIDRRTVHDRIKELGHHQAFKAEIRICASAIRASMADILMASEGAPALTILRRYFNEQGENFASTLTIHPEHRFVYTLELARDD